MVKVLESRKRVFWEALFLTVVVFFLGVLIGISFEYSKVNQIKDYYSYSEANLMDSLALSSLVNLEKNSCADFERTNFDFADRIYNEAVLLEKYENSGKITESIKIEHRKYDLLRTFLWINSIKIFDVCGRNYHSFVYLYEYYPDDLAQKATQSVWSKILYDLKQEYGNNVLLIPIAVDSDLSSLDSLVRPYNIEKYPALIIDNDEVVTELASVEALREYLD